MFFKRKVIVLLRKLAPCLRVKDRPFGPPEEAVFENPRSLEIFWEVFNFYGIGHYRLVKYLEAGE